MDIQVGNAGCAVCLVCGLGKTETWDKRSEEVMEMFGCSLAREAVAIVKSVDDADDTIRAGDAAKAGCVLVDFDG